MKEEWTLLGKRRWTTRCDSSLARTVLLPAMTAAVALALQE